MKTLNLTLAVLLGSLPAWCMSVLIHSMDADVDGRRGLQAPEVIVSTVVIGIAIWLASLLPILAFTLGGWRGFGWTLVTLSGMFGLLVARAGSTATSFSGWALTVVGSSLGFLMVLAIAAAPAVFLLRDDQDLGHRGVNLLRPTSSN